jgi:flagellar biosynthesis GTPase FlhF
MMPSAPDKPPPEPNNVSPPSKGPENPVGSLLSLINKYCAAGDFSRLEAMCQENKELNAKINQLESAYDQNIQALTRSENKWQSEHSRCEEADRARADALKHLKQERDGSQGLRDQVRHMEEKVKTAIATSKSWESQTMELTNSEKAKTTDLKNVQKAMTKVEGELRLRKEELASKTTELARVQENLKVIRSFVIDLQSLADKEVLMYVCPTTFLLFLFFFSFLSSSFSIFIICVYC